MRWQAVITLADVTGYLVLFATLVAAISNESGTVHKTAAYADHKTALVVYIKWILGNGKCLKINQPCHKPSHIQHKPVWQHACPLLHYLLMSVFCKPVSRCRLVFSTDISEKCGINRAWSKHWQCTCNTDPIHLLLRNPHCKNQFTLHASLDPNFPTAVMSNVCNVLVCF